VVRGYTESRHASGSSHCERRVVARIEATKQGLDIRYVITSLRIGSWISGFRMTMFASGEIPQIGNCRR